MSLLEAELRKLKDDQKTITDRWRGEKDEMNRLQYLKEEIERVNLEIQQAERDYDLNRYGTGSVAMAGMLHYMLQSANLRSSAG